MNVDHDYVDAGPDVDPDSEAGDFDVVICPTCGAVIGPELTLWVRLGKWYCSERCVRQSMK